MKRLRQILEWGTAFIIAFLFINIICFPYEKSVAWIDRETGVTSGVRRPYSVLIHGTEGYGITKFDENGFTNSDKPLKKDDYILVMGASHTQGKEVKEEERYTEILNQYVNQGEDEYLSVYNVAVDGNNLVLLIKRFKAGIEEFPNSSTVIMEIDNTDFGAEELLDAIQNQTYFDENETAKRMFEDANIKSKITHFIKEYIPIINLYKTKLKTYKANGSESSDEKNYDTPEYEVAINEALKGIRSEYSGDILFVYHPKIEIQADGSITCLRNETLEVFCEACMNNNIGFLDVGNAFVEYYEENSKVPYGFHNTRMGLGHLNATGHKIMADEIYKVLSEVK